MKAKEFLNKSGIMRSGAVAGTYKNGKDRPTELMMDGVYNAKKDLVTDNEPKPESTPPKDGGEQPPATNTNPSGEQPTKKSKPKWVKYAVITGVVMLVLFILMAIFGTPSADTVFKKSLDEMLQVESVAITQDLNGDGSQGSGPKIDLNSINYIEMSPDSQDLKAKGKFSLDVVNEGVPITAEAEYIAVDGDTYIMFTKLTSSNPTYAQSFDQVGSKIQDKWIKARDVDNFSNFATVATSALTTITALPYANLSDDAREEVVAILQDEDMFTIKESAKVEVDGKQAYRYELEFDKDKQDEAAKKIAEATGYFDAGEGDGNGDIEKLELWIDISTYRFIKMEYSGTSSAGNIVGVINYEAYDEQTDVAKPDEYYVESELLQ